MEDKILFEEKQHFRQVWLWFILIVINGSVIYGVVKRLTVGQLFEEGYTDRTGLILTTVLTMAITILFFNLRLETIIKSDGIYVRFFPFHLTFRRYGWDSISKAFVRQYNPLGEYGGWGIRAGLFGKGRAFNVSGDKGIQLIFNNGSRLLIGTNKPEEATAVLKMIGRLVE
jgi:hypothetical protein